MKHRNTVPGLIFLLVVLIFTGGCGAKKEPAAQQTQYTSLSELEDKRIGVTTGSVQAIQAKERFPDADIFYYDSTTDMLAALRTGKIDAFAEGETLVRYIMPENPDLTYLEEYLSGTMQICAIFPKSEKGKALCDEFNDFLRQIKESGEYDELLETWFGPDEEKKTVPDLDTLKGKRGTLRVAADTTMLPFAFIKDGKPVGIDIDTVYRFCRDRDYSLELVPMAFPGILPAVSTGKCDMACSAIAYTKERAESVLFAEPNFEGGSVVAVLKASGAEGADTGGTEEGDFFNSVKNSFVRNFIREDRWKLILSGFRVTVALSVLAGIFGTVLGGCICFLRMRQNRLASGFAGLYIRLFRGIPIVVLLLVLNYLVFTGAKFPAFWVCVIGFSLDFAAYTSEIFRNGIEAVPAGQTRAARALGFGSLQGFWKVAYPQALIHILPVYSGQFISLVKLTSVSGYISVMDLTRASDIIRSRTYEAFFPLIFTAVIYFLLSALLIALLRGLEKRIAPGTRRTDEIEKLVKAWLSENRERPAREPAAPVSVSGRSTGLHSEQEIPACDGQDIDSVQKPAMPEGISEERPNPERNSEKNLEKDFEKAPEENSEKDSDKLIFRISHLRKSFGDVTPVRDISCEIREGDVISVIGPSGTGKSTFLNLLNQLEKPDGGEIYFKGINILQPGTDLNLLRRQVGMVFQAFFLFSHLTIVENIMLAQEELLGRTKEEAFRCSMEMLEKTGLADKALNYPNELSGGQQQRAAIARELAMDPEVILFDEPTSALDPTTIGEVLSVIRNLALNGMTMVIVTHEMNFARDVANRVFYVDEGIIYEEGTPDQIFDSPKKEKTRQFIRHLKTLRIQIAGRSFDYAGAVTQIEAFGHRHLIDHAVMRRMITITEELGVSILLDHYQEKTDAEIIFEYQEETGGMHMKTVFEGADFDPLRQGDPVCTALIRNAAQEITYTCAEGKGIVKGRLSRPLPSDMLDSMHNQGKGYRR